MAGPRRSIYDGAKAEGACMKEWEWSDCDEHDRLIGHIRSSFVIDLMAYFNPSTTRPALIPSTASGARTSAGLTRNTRSASTCPESRR